LAAEQVELRLAAVLAADVAGYSRLMGADEEATLAELKADSAISSHRAASSKRPVMARWLSLPAPSMRARGHSNTDGRSAVQIGQGTLERDVLSLVKRRLNHARPDSAPAAASTTTTIQGAIFQTVSTKKPPSASAKSRGLRTALVQTGL
jgi:hypothetical protein